MPEVPALALLFHGPVAAVLIAVSLLYAVLAARGSARAESALRVARVALFAYAVVSFALACLQVFLDRDRVHDFWSAQIPLVVGFLGSGPLIAALWSDDPRGRRMAFLFAAILAALASLPLVAIELLPAGGGRNTGEPARHLLEMIRWGFGGPLPECLAPRVEFELARGVGHLQREVTVPFGTILVAAWAWIAWVALAITARLVPTLHARRTWSALAPVVVAVAVLLVPDGTTIGAFDPRFFGPDSARSSGIWESDPAVMRSFGSVLLAAAIAFVLFAAFVRRSRSTGSEPASASEARGGDARGANVIAAAAPESSASEG